MKKHKWEKGGKGWYKCLNCGLIKEKHFGLPWLYYNGSCEYIKAPPCVNSTKDNEQKD